MKIIRTPLDWESNPDDNWLHSVDYIETADISVDELESESRTGTVTFTQDETSDQKEVTVIQKRVTFYYSVGTNYGPGATFDIGGVLVVSDENGVATRVWTSTPSSTAPETMLATPETDIRALAVNPSLVEFPAEGGDAHETFTWTDWDKTGVTVHRSANAVPQVSINTASTTITSVTEVSGPNWLTLNNNGDIHANVNTGSERTGFVEYINYGKTATVQVIQKEKPITEKYFGVKTISNLAEGQHVIFTVDGEDLQPVNFSERGEYYIAVITASPDASVSVSCDISDFTIDATPNKLYFSPNGETKTVNVDAEKRLLQANHQILTGCTDLSDLTKLFTIVENTGTCGYNSEIVSGSEYFTINGNSITASQNTTHSARTGQAKFTHAEDEGENATVDLAQENIHYFIFKSTVIGSPSTGQVSFYENNYCGGNPFMTIPYETTGNAQKVDEQIYRDVNEISYKIEGFEPKGSISASTNRVIFSPIEMVYNSGDGKYHLSNIEKEVGVTAIGASYEYQKKVDGQGKTYPDYQDYLSGAISANSEVEVNATANTTNRFTVTVSSFTPPTSWASYWSYTTDYTTEVIVTTKATIPVLSARTLTLAYALEGVPTLSAKTDFILPDSATSNIELQNFALSSKTAFGEDCKSPTVANIPTGSSAYTFAFWPPSRSEMGGYGGAASSLSSINVAEMRYGTSGTPRGWMLFYPLSSAETSGNTNFSNFVAKIYALSYVKTASTAYATSVDDAWTLGPLLYKSASTAPYKEVEGFEFSTGHTRVDVTKTDSTTSAWPNNPTYPSECPFSSALSGSSNYFQLWHKPTTGSPTLSAASTGSISVDKKTWTISGHGVGGLRDTTSPSSSKFFSRIEPMRIRNYYFHCVPNSAANCDIYNDFHTPTPAGMAHAVEGYIDTNLLGSIGLKMIYFGKITGTCGDDGCITYSVPADSHIVTPRNPGDTTSVIYDAETNTYLIYDIDSVIILDRVTTLVVPEADLIDFKVPVDDEIIAPPHP